MTPTRGRSLKSVSRRARQSHHSSAVLAPLVTIASGNDIRVQPAFEDDDLVLQLQLLSLQSADRELIAATRRRQFGDCRVEVAVLEPQLRQPLANCPLLGSAAHLVTVFANPSPADW